ncbi:unnamed protein product [Cylindrotheca closterium]|uniref:Uncharacterized protein n=1 Tax=Cylindrotheca closterium TaxID=2856 RepID=A0AAD2CRM8_9STRA|nr:unnamed protein product [Cylindrotheca closterium]
MFPDSQKGSLNATKLKKLGLAKGRMEEDDALFFFQLLYPICDPKRSGIKQDPWKGFYFELEKFTRTYAGQNGIGGSYGHIIHDVLARELVVFHGIMVQDGVRGGSKGAVYRQGDPSCSCYD